MNKNVIIAASALILAGGIGTAYWYGNQPNITYYPNGKMKTFVERKFFKENGAGKLYDEKGKLIHTYNVIDGKKNGTAKLIFKDGEMKFGYFNNKVSGEMHIDADVDVKDFADLGVSANEGTIKIQKKNDNNAFKITAQIVCEDEPFILALQKLADERNQNNFIQLAKCLNIERFRFTEDDGNFEFEMNGGFQYPEFNETTTIAVRAPDYESSTEMNAVDFTITGKNITVKYKNEEGNIEITGDIVGENEEIFKAAIEAYNKSEEDKFDYKTFENLAGKLEITGAKLDLPESDVNCTYSGGFTYPGFVKDSKLECNAKADTDKIDALVRMRPEAKVFLSSMAGVKNVKTSLNYITKDDELAYTSQTDNKKLLVKISSKGLKKLIPMFVKYAFSEQGEGDTIKLIEGVLRNYSISSLETSMNGRVVSKFDGSLNFADGFSGMFSSKGYINSKMVANITLKGRHLNIRLNYPLSGKVLGDINIKFKENLADNYRKTTNTILQSMKANTSLPERMAKIEGEAKNLANSLESIDGTLVNEKGQKVASVLAKIRLGADINDESLTLPEKVELSVYTYNNNKPAKIFKATKDGYYSDGKTYSEKEVFNAIGKEEIDNITERLSKDFEELQRLMMKGKLDISASPVLGVMAVGAISGYSKAMSKYGTNKIFDQAIMIITNTRTIYSQQTSYDGLNNSSAINMGLIPDEMGTDAETGTLVNALGGSAYISSARLSSDDGIDADGNRAFVLTYSGLSREACVNLATSDWGSGSSSGLVGVAAYGYSVTEAQKEDTDLVLNGKTPCAGSAYVSSDKVIACADGSNMRVPMSINDAVEACNCEGQNTCSFTWKYF